MGNFSTLSHGQLRDVLLELESGECSAQEVGAALCNVIRRMIAAPGRVISDDQIRAAWRSAGGEFHGPSIETGTMPESKLIPFLRGLMLPNAEAKGPRSGPA